MKIGNISFNPEAFKDYTKEQFFAEYAGKLVIDKEQVWQMIIDANINVKADTRIKPDDIIHPKTFEEIKKQADESINNISEPGKKSKRGRTDEGTQSGS